MLLRISHETRLKYTRPVAETIFEVRMGPQSDDDQTVLGYRLRVAPRGAVTAYRDGYGNRVDLFNILTPYQELVVSATSFVRTHRRLSAARLAGVTWPGEYPIGVDALEFLQPSPLVGPCQELDDFVASLPPRQGTLADVCRNLIDCVRDRLAYEKKITGVHTHVADTLRLGRGVCQDFSHLFVGACRAIGLPARYVSGYIHQPGEIATHAWVQVWAGSTVGWVDVDPTHGYFPEDDHVVTAVGRDYRDVPPNRGFWRGKSEETISVTVKVEQVDRMPPQWQEWGPPLAGIPGPASLREGPASRRPQRRTMPDQPPVPPGVRHQQGQQQQSHKPRRGDNQ